VAVLGRAGAELHGMQPVPGHEVHAAAWTVSVSIGCEVRAVVEQPGQLNGAVGQVGGHRDASGLQLDAKLLVRGGFGPVLANPLGRVLTCGPVPDRGHHLLQGIGVVLEFREQGELVESQLAGQLTGRLPGCSGEAACLQGLLDLLRLQAGGLAQPGPGGARFVGGEQRGGFLDGVKFRR
jgi:hypothetical protein